MKNLKLIFKIILGLILGFSLFIAFQLLNGYMKLNYLIIEMNKIF